MQAKWVLPIVDIAFPVRGDPIPGDHGVALFEMLARAIGRNFDADAWAVHPIRGRRVTNGMLSLDHRSFLQIRLPAAAVSAVAGLPACALVLDGVPLALGPPTVRPLAPSDALRADFVHLPGALEDGDATVLGAVRRELDAMPIAQTSDSIQIRVGRRRLMSVGDASIVGLPIELSLLEADASLEIQAHGIGTRRQYGAGLFVPPSGERRR